MQQGVLVCDRNGRVIYCNQAYADFAKIPLKEMQGRPIKKLRQGALVPQVLQSGQAIEGAYRREENQEYFVNIYPILEESRVVGTVSIVTSLKIRKLEEETIGKTLKERVAEFEKSQIRQMIEIYGDTVEGKKRVARELGISLSTLYEKLSYCPKNIR